MTNDPIPERLALFKQSGDCVILAEDHGSSGYSGIEIDRADADEVQRLLTINHKHLQSAWKTYAAERIGSYLLLDTWRLASAMRRSKGRVDIMPLRKITSAYELMHNRYQAQLMQEACAVYPGRVGLITTARGKQAGDFAIAGKQEREFEVKTILATGVVERRRTGWTISEDTACKVARDLRRKAKQGFQQLGAHGTVICLLWCDITGAAVSTELEDREVPVQEIFSGVRYVIGTRSKSGEDRWLAFKTDEEWGAALQQLETKLNKRRQRSLNMGLPDLKFFTTRREWSGVGRAITIDGSRQYEE